ncbi:hypothetical protein F9K50_04555 [bacterium]|nr:MAG: hypothetical protein F9K50_04555 [bacterium]
MPKSKQNHESKGFGLKLIDQLQNEGSAHHEVINKIEKLTKRNLLCYTAFLGHPAGTISLDDSQIIEQLLRSIDLSKYPGTLDLLLHTPGGDPTAAERIILTCRSYSKSFRVLIAHTAMSAGTLIAMGADSIVMTETAELGPIDPQMIINTPQGQSLRPAAAFVDAYKELINKAQDAIARSQPPHPYLELLRKMDPTWIQVCLKARELSKTIATEFLKKFMLHDKTPQDIEKTIEYFVKEGELLSHGRVIRHAKVKEYGLNVDVIKKGDELDELLWELQLRCELYVQSRGFAKYFVSRTGGINMKVQKMPD